MASIHLLECIEAIENWVECNQLKMNPDKTQLICLGGRQQLAMLNIEPLRLHDRTLIVPSMSVRNLGIVFDSSLSMTEYVSNINNSYFYQLRQLRSVRRSLSNDTTTLLVHALISSRVEYCNSLPFGASPHVLLRLQAVTNGATRLITGHGRFNYITSTLQDEHTGSL